MPEGLTAGGRPDGESAPLQRARLRRGLTLVAAIGVLAAVLIAVLAGGREVLTDIARLPLATLAVAAALNVASWLGEAVVFASLAGRRGIRQVVRMVAVYVGGGFPALVTPFGSGGLAGWTWALTREGLSAGEAAAVVGARGLLTSVFFVLAAGAAVLVVPARLSRSGAALWFGLAGLVLVFAAVAWVVVRPTRAAYGLHRLLTSRASRALLGPARAERLADAASVEARRFADGLRSLTRERPGALVVALAGLLASRACLLAILPVILAGLGWTGDLLPVFASVVAVWALASASPTPGGSGAADAAMAAALSVFAPHPVAGAAALLWRGLTFYFDLVAGWLLFARYLAGRRS